MDSSCLAMILCMFAEPYDSHIDAVCEHSSEVVNLLELSGAEIPKEYVQDKCEANNLYDAHLWLIKETQTSFFARTGERQDAKIPQWILDHSIEIEKESSQVIQALVTEKSPSHKDIECIAILGATMKEASLRIAYWQELINQHFSADKIYLLGSTRKPFKNEINENIKTTIENRYHTNVTESSIMEYLYENSCVGSYPKPIIINTLPCNRKLEEVCSRNRANTDDTIEAFLDQSDCKFVTFISRAPNTIAQYEAIAPIIARRNPNLKFEVVGGKASLSEVPQDQHAHALYHVLMPFAGALFGSFERVSASISEKLGQCPANYEYLYDLKISYKKSFQDAIIRSDKNLHIPN
jgi:hypothetical protein